MAGKHTEHAAMQEIAKQTLLELKKWVKPGMPLAEIVAYCEGKMKELGADSFWYWDVGAFVFAGSGTRRSLSGKGYAPADRELAENDMLTVDLSPQRDGVWGDYARTIVGGSFQASRLFKRRHGGKDWRRNGPCTLK